MEQQQKSWEELLDTAEGFFRQYAEQKGAPCYAIYVGTATKPATWNFKVTDVDQAWANVSAYIGFLIDQGKTNFTIAVRSSSKDPDALTIPVGLPRPVGANIAGTQYLTAGGGQSFGMWEKVMELQLSNQSLQQSIIQDQLKREHEAAMAGMEARITEIQESNTLERMLENPIIAGKAISFIDKLMEKFFPGETTKVVQSAEPAQQQLISPTTKRTKIAAKGKPHTDEGDQDGTEEAEAIEALKLFKQQGIDNPGTFLKGAAMLMEKEPNILPLLQAKIDSVLQQ